MVSSLSESNHLHASLLTHSWVSYIYLLVFWQLAWQIDTFYHIYFQAEIGGNHWHINQSTLTHTNSNCLNRFSYQDRLHKVFQTNFALNLIVSKRPDLGKSWRTSKNYFWLILSFNTSKKTSMLMRNPLMKQTWNMPFWGLHFLQTKRYILQRVFLLKTLCVKQNKKERSR